MRVHRNGHGDTSPLSVIVSLAGLYQGTTKSDSMGCGASPFRDTMNTYYRAILAIVVIGAVTCTAGCTQIKLGDKKGGTGGTTTSGSTGSGGAPMPNEVVPAQPPPLQGVWDLSFTFGNQNVGAKMELQQQGTALAGQGQDFQQGEAAPNPPSGSPWAVVDGVVEGNKVRFSKQYSPDRPSIVHEGELKWLSDPPHFTGWMIEGHYQTQGRDGKPITGDWVATPEDPSLMPAPAAPVSSAPPPPSNTSNPGSSLIGVPPPSAHHDDGKPPHLSGRYDGEYEFNFKRIKMKMWLEQDNNRVTGHGVDLNTNEKFTIERGWYKHPNLTLIRKYFKGTGAAATREFTFKGKVSNGPKGPVLNGETQYGGDWTASIVR